MECLFEQSNFEKLLPKWDNLKKIGSKKDMINFIKDQGWDPDDEVVREEMYQSIFKINRTYYFRIE